MRTCIYISDLKCNLHEPDLEFLRVLQTNVKNSVELLNVFSLHYPRCDCFGIIFLAKQKQNKIQRKGVKQKFFISHASEKINRQNNNFR